MIKTIANQIPFILTGITLNKEGLFAKTHGWNSQEVRESIESVERRYKALTSHEISDYNGLFVFCEIVKLFKEIPAPSSAQQDLILKAQKRVLHYHNIQYEHERTKKNGLLPKGDDSKLPDASKTH